MTNRLLATLVAAVIIVPSASAQVVPHGDFFGTLSGATFGGSGIPNDAVMQGGVDGMTLGLTAHQRYAGADLLNDGAGTFYASPGEAVYNGQNGSLWNFAFNITGANRDQYQYRLLYDLNPAVGNGGHGVVETGLFASLVGYEGSENATFSYLALPGIPGLWTGPSYTSFDSFVSGEYTFELQQLDQQFQVLSSVGIAVNVGTPGETVPEPATMTLLATGLAGLAASRRKKKSQG